MGHIEVGSAGEAAALSTYLARGYRVVARNWRCSIGEIDLVLGRGDLVVFCEVKTRRGTARGSPFEAVTARKQRKLRGLAEAFLSSSALRPGAIRFDVASVTLAPGGTVSVHLYEDAF